MPPVANGEEDEFVFHLCFGESFFDLWHRVNRGIGMLEQVGEIFRGSGCWCVFVVR